jgi:hypothetical protein
MAGSCQIAPIVAVSARQVSVPGELDVIAYLNLRYRGYQNKDKSDH